MMELDRFIQPTSPWPRNKGDDAGGQRDGSMDGERTQLAYISQPCVVGMVTEYTSCLMNCERISSMDFGSVIYT